MTKEPVTHFNLGRYELVREGSSKIIHVHDDLIGAKMSAHEKAFEKGIEQLYFRGTLGYKWKCWVYPFLKLALAFGIGYSVACIRFNL